MRATAPEAEEIVKRMKVTRVEDGSLQELAKHLRDGELLVPLGMGGQLKVDKGTNEGEQVVVDREMNKKGNETSGKGRE